MENVTFSDQAQDRDDLVPCKKRKINSSPENNFGWEM
jgi:hypothetical protein